MTANIMAEGGRSSRTAPSSAPTLHRAPRRSRPSTRCSDVPMSSRSTSASGCAIRSRRPQFRSTCARSRSVRSRLRALTCVLTVVAPVRLTGPQPSTRPSAGGAEATVPTSGLAGDRDPVHLVGAGIPQHLHAPRSNVARVVRMSSTRITRPGGRRSGSDPDHPPPVPHAGGAVDPMLALRLQAPDENAGDGQTTSRREAVRDERGLVVAALDAGGVRRDGRESRPVR